MLMLKSRREMYKFGPHKQRNSHFNHGWCSGSVSNFAQLRPEEKSASLSVGMLLVCIVDVLTGFLDNNAIGRNISRRSGHVTSQILLDSCTSRTTDGEFLFGRHVCTFLQKSRGMYGKSNRATQRVAASVLWSYEHMECSAKTRSSSSQKISSPPCPHSHPYNHRNDRETTSVSGIDSGNTGSVDQRKTLSFERQNDRHFDACGCYDSICQTSGWAGSSKQNEFARQQQ